MIITLENFEHKDFLDVAEFAKKFVDRAVVKVLEVITKTVRNVLKLKNDVVKLSRSIIL